MLNLRKAKTIGCTLAALSMLVLAPGCGAPIGGSDSSYYCSEPDTPQLLQIIPDKVPQYQPDLLMIINGARFEKRSVVYAGDKTQTTLVTTYIKGSQLTAFLPAMYMQNKGQVAISVTNFGACTDGSASGVIKSSNFLYVEVQ